MNECVRCRNEWHEGCNGGSWDDKLLPVVCSCWALRNHAKTARKGRATNA